MGHEDGIGWFCSGVRVLLNRSKAAIFFGGCCGSGDPRSVRRGRPSGSSALPCYGLAEAEGENAMLVFLGDGAGALAPYRTLSLRERDYEAVVPGEVREKSADF